MDSRPIGVFDSGVGGLTVVREVWRKLPKERVLYFGDTARVPYGGRPAAEIEVFAREIISYLRKLGAKLVIVACNTTSALALDEVGREFDVPLVGVLRPGARSAVSATRAGRIGVIATEGTTRSGAYERAIRELMPEAAVFSKACPMLVPLIEAGRTCSREAEEALRDYLAPLLESDIDTLVLGCTHYPFLEDAIRRIVGPDVTIVDPAGETVEVASVLLRDLGLSSHERTGPDQFAVSGDPEGFTRVAEKLLGKRLPRAAKVDLRESSINRG
ncbi:MAG: glutamate racemase [Firmicutes bacterium]|nr:glutamate racemase [Bacillota bacterium]MDH7494514.1 glutamate racemase [Bacillota bacterium]